MNQKEAHIYSGFTYVVVDVKENKIIQQAYAVVSNGMGGFVSKKLDKVIINK